MGNFGEFIERASKGESHSYSAELFEKFGDMVALTGLGMTVIGSIVPDTIRELLNKVSTKPHLSVIVTFPPDCRNHHNLNTALLVTITSSSSKRKLKIGSLLNECY